MHRPIKQRLEEYLLRAGRLEDPKEFDPHMKSCGRCRQEVEGMAEQARLLRLLEAPAEIEPAPGFYARVMGSLEATRGAPLWYEFLDPAFARRLTYACLATVVILGSYLVYSGQGPQSVVSNAVSFMAAESSDSHLGADPQRDRETVLVSLASYQE